MFSINIALTDPRRIRLCVSAYRDTEPLFLVFLPECCFFLFLCRLVIVPLAIVTTSPLSFVGTSPNQNSENVAVEYSSNAASGFPIYAFVLIFGVLFVDTSPNNCWCYVN